jgi:hypothetical protein
VVLTTYKNPHDKWVAVVACDMAFTAIHITFIVLLFASALLTGNAGIPNVEPTNSNKGSLVTIQKYSETTVWVSACLVGIVVSAVSGTIVDVNDFRIFATDYWGALSLFVRVAITIATICILGPPRKVKSIFFCCKDKEIDINNKRAIDDAKRNFAKYKDADACKSFIPLFFLIAGLIAVGTYAMWHDAQP